MSAVKTNSRYVTIRFTHGELKQLLAAVQNCEGDGDWIDYLKKGGSGSTEPAKAIRDFQSGWDKLKEGFGEQIS